MGNRIRHILWVSGFYRICNIISVLIKSMLASGCFFCRNNFLCHVCIRSHSLATATPASRSPLQRMHECIEQSGGTGLLFDWGGNEPHSLHQRSCVLTSEWAPAPPGPDSRPKVLNLPPPRPIPHPPSSKQV